MNEEFNGTLFVEMMRQLVAEGKPALEDLDLAIFNTLTEDGLPREIVIAFEWLRGIIDHYDEE